MEQRFFRDDFEQFLKDTADEFRMYPSKRVWSSLYNNLHPARRWPSISVWLLLISSMIYIGVAHQNEFYKTVSETARNQATEISGTLPILANNSPLQSRVDAGNSPIIPNTGSKPADQSQHFKDQLPPAATTTRNISAGDDRSSGKSSPEAGTTGNIITANIIRGNAVINITSQAPGQETEAVIDDVVKTSNVRSEEIDFKGGTLSKSAVHVSVAYRQAGMPRIKPFVLYSATKSRKEVDKEWIEDHAFHNQPRTSFRAKALDQFYITPSVGYRTLVKNVGIITPARSANAAFQNEETSIKQHPALNLEAGYNVLYPYSKLIRLKAGVQLNYSKYTTEAYRQEETSLTTLLLNDEYSGGIKLEQRGTKLSTFRGAGKATRLNNSSMQVSVPFGADLKLAGRHDLKWFVGATVQPTYVLFGNAYLISSDRQNFVMDADLLRKWNLNTGVETFVSYQGKNGVTFQAGPQFRYQVLSTYAKPYTYTERLYNFGVKLSVVKNL